MPESRGTTGAVGILGGTFDPVHLAHLALAHVAYQQLGLTQVVWIPAGQPPHRTCPGTTAADRLAMVRLAIAGEPHFVVDSSEVASTAPSYTVQTLVRLRQEFGPSRPLVLLMGADAFRGLPHWYRWQDICELAHIAVATRPGFPLEEFDDALDDMFQKRRTANADFSTPAGSIVPFELVAGTVSATEVRTCLTAAAPEARLRELLPAPVLDYIRHHHLYHA
jgi:nicotinate-nucleotide adenylyltransferase